MEYAKGIPPLLARPAGGFSYELAPLPCERIHGQRWHPPARPDQHFLWYSSDLLLQLQSTYIVFAAAEKLAPIRRLNVVVKNCAHSAAMALRKKETPD
jgi:hypothetical protein